MEVRRLITNDVEGFLSLWSSVYAEGEYLDREPPPFDLAKKIISKVVQFEIPSFVALENAVIVGSIEIYPPTLFGSEDIFLIQEGFLGTQILANFRGYGIGRKLMEIGIKDSIRYGYSRIELDVHKTNIRAINLYEAFNFKWVADGDKTTLQSGIKTRSQKMILNLDA